jgi:hypothetical protein
VPYADLVEADVQEFDPVIVFLQLLLDQVQIRIDSIPLKIESSFSVATPS